MEIAVFEKFLKEHIKVDNKTNNLGSTVTVVREKAKLSVHSDVAMSKVASGKDRNAYELRYFKIADAGAEEDEEDE